MSLRALNSFVDTLLLCLFFLCGAGKRRQTRRSNVAGPTPLCSLAKEEGPWPNMVGTISVHAFLNPAVSQPVAASAFSKLAATLDGVMLAQFVRSVQSIAIDAMSCDRASLNVSL